MWLNVFLGRFISLFGHEFVTVTATMFLIICYINDNCYTIEWPHKQSGCLLCLRYRVGFPAEVHRLMARICTVQVRLREYCPTKGKANGESIGSIMYVVAVVWNHGSRMDFWENIPRFLGKFSICSKGPGIFYSNHFFTFPFNLGYVSYQLETPSSTSSINRKCRVS